MLKRSIIPDLLKREGRINAELPSHAGQAVADFIPPEYRVEGWKFILLSSGEVPLDKINETPVKGFDSLVIAREPKDPVSATIAIVAAIGAFAALDIAIATAISIGLGVYSIASMLRAQKPSTASNSVNSGLANSRTYGWDGIQNSSDVDIPVPIVYGKHLIGGNVINAYLDNEGNTGTLHVLYALCEGRVKSIAGIGNNTDAADVDAIGDNLLIEGQPARNYKGVKVMIRRGQDDQDFVPGFNELHALTEYSDLIQKSGGWHYYTTPVDITDLEKLKLHFFAPNMRIVDEETGEMKTLTHQFLIGTRNVEDSDPDPWDDREMTISGKTVSAKRWDYTRNDLPPGRYNIRIKKLTGDTTQYRSADVLLKGIDAIRKKKFRYPLTALLGLEIRATEQLSGRLSSVQVVVEGKNDMMIYDGEDWSKNYSRSPAWCLYDFLTKKRYGLGDFIETASLDPLAYLEAADWCAVPIDVDGEEDVPRALMDIVIDAEQKGLDLVNMLCATFRCMPVYSEGSVRPVIDKETPVTDDYGMGNIVRGTFVEDFKSLRSGKNRVEIQFIDSANGWRRDLVQIQNEASIQNGDPIKLKTYFMPVTRRSQAIWLGQYYLGLETLVRSVNFQTGINGCKVRAGEVVNFSHDVPQWSIGSGRVTAGNADWVKVDFPVTLLSGKTYWVRVQHADDSIEEVMLEMAPGTYPAGTELTLGAGQDWDQVPQGYDNAKVGEEDINGKPFRIMSILRGHDCNVTLGLLEYNESVYADNGVVIPTPQYSTLPDPRTLPPEVIDLTAINSIGYDPTIYLSWDIPVDNLLVYEQVGIIDRFEVFLSEDQQTWVKIGSATATERTFTYDILVPGRTYYFRVSTVSRAGTRVAIADAPQVTITVNLQLLPPNVTGLELKGQGNERSYIGKDATFRWNEMGKTTANPISDPLGAGAGTYDLHFKDFKIEIWANGRKVREQYQVQPEFNYTYEMNYADNRRAAARDFTVKVWMRDTYNQISQIPAELPVSNPPELAPENATAVGAASSVVVTWDEVIDIDHDHYEVFMSQTPGFLPTAENRVYSGRMNQVQIKELTALETYYFRVSAVDTFGNENQTYTDELNSIATLVDIPPGSITASMIQVGTLLANLFVSGQVVKTFKQTSTPTSLSVGDLWYKTDLGGDVVAVYRAAIIGADAITAGEWETFDPAIWLNNGTTTIDGNIITTGTILAEKLFINYLSAISADLGNITGGSITLTLPSGVSGHPNNKLRIDNQGIYVSIDNGSTWRKFLAVDDNGDLVISFDAFDPDTAIPGIFTQGAIEIVDYYTHDRQIITSSGAWSAWALGPATTFDQQKEMLLVDVYVDNDSVGSTTDDIEIGLYDSSGTLVWSSATISDTDGIDATWRLIAQEIAVPVYLHIPKGDFYRVAWRYRVQTGRSAKLQIIARGTKLEDVEMLALTSASKLGTGSYGTWDLSKVTTMAANYECVFLTAEGENTGLGSDTLFAKLAVFDPSDLSTPLASVEVSESVDAGSNESMAFKFSLALRGVLGIGDSYRIGVQWKSTNNFTVNAALSKTRPVGQGAVVKD